MKSGYHQGAPDSGGSGNQRGEKQERVGSRPVSGFMPRRVSGAGDGAAQGPGSPRTGLELTAKDRIGRVAAEGGIRGSPMRAGIRRRAPPARGPGTPEFRNPRLGARAAARCHGLPGRAAWRAGVAGAGQGWSRARLTSDPGPAGRGARGASVFPSFAAALQLLHSSTYLTCY